MAGYYAHIVKRTPTGSNSCFEEGDTTSLAVGWTQGCLRCAQKRAVTADNLELHIECLEDELQAARELLEEMKRRGQEGSLATAAMDASGAP